MEKILGKQLDEVRSRPIAGIAIIESDDLMEWFCFFQCKRGMFSNATLIGRLEFSTEYPVEKPKILAVTEFGDLKVFLICVTPSRRNFFCFPDCVGRLCAKNRLPANKVNQRNVGTTFGKPSNHRKKRQRSKQRFISFFLFL